MPKCEFPRQAGSDDQRAEKFDRLEKTTDEIVGILRRFLESKGL